MTLLILIFLFALATYLGVLGWKRTCGALCATALSLFLMVALGWVPAWLLGNLQTSYTRTTPQTWGQRNAIILLGSGTAKVPGNEHFKERFEAGIFANARLIRVTALYRVCKQHSPYCKVILSGGDPLQIGASEAKVYQSQLLELGVTPTDLILEPRSRNTWQNAQYTKALLAPLNVDRILLVTSALHMRRSLLYFSHFDIQAQPIRADYLKAHHTLTHNAWNFVLTDFALNEYIGIARYYIYNRLGLNAPAVSKIPAHDFNPNVTHF